MNLSTMAASNLLRRPGRSLLTLLGIATAVGGFVAMVGLARGAGNAWTSHLSERGVDVLALRKGTVEVLATTLDANLGPLLADVEGVADVDGELVQLLVVDGGPTAYVSGWDADGFLNQTLPISSGRNLRPGETDVCVLGESIAKALGKKVGDKLSLQGRSFRVVGAFRRDSVIASNSITIPVSQLQEMTGWQGRITALNLQVETPGDGAETEAVIERLSREFPELTFVETSRVADQDRVMQLLRAIAWGFSAVAIAIGAVVMLNTLLMAVIERTREIGVLSALGWSSGRVLGMIVLEGLILSGVGSLLGMVLGLVGLHWVASSSAIGGFLEPDVSPTLAVEVLCAAIGLGLVGSIYPALRAVRLNVVDALRYE